MSDTSRRFIGPPRPPPEEEAATAQILWRQLLEHQQLLLQGQNDDDDDDRQNFTGGTFTSPRGETAVYRYGSRRRRQQQRPPRGRRQLRHDNNHSQRHRHDHDDDDGRPVTRRRRSSFWRHRMHRVGRRAAMHTKTLVWDSNETTVNAAAGLVDHWERAYGTVRNAVTAASHSAHAAYGAAKRGATRMERGVLSPVRDWILLPAFGGVECGWTVTVDFVRSPHARHLGESIVRNVAAIPFVGEHALAPALVFSAVFCQRTWDVLQYPIPSKHRVRSIVDGCLNATKRALTAAVTECVMFCKRADAILSRTLSRTRWNLLGTGPYLELDERARTEILRHLTERYLNGLHHHHDEDEDESSSSVRAAAVARYEWVAHIRRRNARLATDLQEFLLRHCADRVSDDEWLHPCPVYRHLQRPFLLPEEDDDDDYDDDATAARRHRLRRRALWFYQPAVNGTPPSRDTPWIPLSAAEQVRLETQYESLVTGKVPLAYGAFESNLEQQQQGEDASSPPPPAPFDETVIISNRAMDDDDDDYEDDDDDDNDRYPDGPAATTMAHWYAPNPVTDVLVDQKRHCVTLMAACPVCEASLELTGGPPRIPTPPRVCRDCRRRGEGTSSDHWTPTAVAHPSYTARRRPVLWRFYGTGDVVRRSVWFLDCGPHKGLQPFDVEASKVLEDAYWFLQWMALQQQQEAEEEEQQQQTELDQVAPKNPEETPANSGGLDGSLLTVEVTCPDGASRLVQFSSLSQATAIQKGLGAAFAIHKRRVYRGAWLGADDNNNNNAASVASRSVTGGNTSHAGTPPTPLYPSSVDMPLTPARHLSSSDAFLPSVPLRDVLTPPVPPTPRSAPSPLLYAVNQGRHDLSVPPSRFHQEDMARYWVGEDDTDGASVDHLCLIVHGIGEMLRSIDVFGLSLPNLASIVDCCGYLRRNHAAVQQAQFSQMCPGVNGNDRTLGTIPGRVEYLPVEWHEAFSVLSQRRLAPSSLSSPDSGRPPVMMQDISLRTIPNMRDFANDTLMDVLYFMSPEHHDIMIDIVTREMNTVVQKFCDLTGFRGRVSVIGHSLGSILSFDILANQNIDLYVGDQEGFIPGVASQDSLDSFLSARSTEPSGERSAGNEDPEQDMEPELSVPTATPTETRKSKGHRHQFEYPQLDFEVDNFFLLGSPVAVFLMIRNQQQPLREDYYLRGCHRVFNIFHPYDPVAYRIEPCLDPRNAEFESTIMPHWNGGFRVQYQTKRLWRKLVDTTYRTQQNVVEAFEASMAGMGLLDTTTEAHAADEDDEEDDEMSSSEASDRPNYVVTGQLNQGRRIDYMLQEREIEHANEYVAALAAHSSYWVEKDLSLFIARQIYLSSLERAVQYAPDDEDTWQPIDQDMFAGIDEDA